MSHRESIHLDNLTSAPPLTLPLGYRMSLSCPAAVFFLTGFRLPVRPCGEILHCPRKETIASNP